MTRLRLMVGLLGLTALMACEPVTPTAGVSAGTGGVGAGVGVEFGPDQCRGRHRRAIGQRRCRAARQCGCVGGHWRCRRLGAAGRRADPRRLWPRRVQAGNLSHAGHALDYPAGGTGCLRHRRTAGAAAKPARRGGSRPGGQRDGVGRCTDRRGRPLLTAGPGRPSGSARARAAGRRGPDPEQSVGLPTADHASVPSGPRPDGPYGACDDGPVLCGKGGRGWRRGLE